MVMFKELGNQLGRVLQDCVDNDDRITLSIVEARRHGNLFAEVAAQIHHGNIGRANLDLYCCYLRKRSLLPIRFYPTPHKRL